MLKQLIKTVLCYLAACDVGKT